jgi:thiamine transport system substrate-binding protein
MKKLFVTTLSVLMLTGCVSAEPTSVRLATHDSFVITDELKEQFEKESGFTLEIIRMGDTGSLTNQLVLTKNAPIADAVFGIDNTFMSVAIDNKVFEGEPIAIDYSDVCLNYDIAFLESLSIAPPTSWRDLTRPSYKGLTVLTDPNLSSPGLAFLATTVAGLGTGGALKEYWDALRSNEVLIAGSWEDAYFTHFSKYGGKYPIVLSYASSPAAEVGEDGKPATKAMLSECFRQTEFAAVLLGAQNTKGAEALVDFLQSQEFQSSVAENMYVYPVLETATIPESWSEFAKPALSTIGEELDFDKDRDLWLDVWQSTQSD